MFGGFVDLRGIYIFFRGVSGILVETGPISPHEQWHFMVFSASSRAIPLLTSPPISQKWLKKSETAFVGEGGRNRYMRAESLFFAGFQNGGPIGGGPGRFWSMANSAPS